MHKTFYTLNIKEITKETNDTVSISFDVPNELEDTFTFLPGQHLTLKTQINGEEIRRSYSICSASFENNLTVAIKEIENGVFSSYANSTLKVGDQLETLEPNGNFKIETNPSNSKNYILYAAGSGITPIISMVKTVLEAEPSSNIQLYYGNKTAADTIFKAELDALNAAHSNFNLTYILSREESGSTNTNGRIDAEKCASFYADNHASVNIDAVYMCGPEEMVMCVKDFYTNKGVDKSKLHFELFTTSGHTVEAPILTGEPFQSEITVIIDDEEFEFALKSDGKDILQAAQDEDADVPFSCKGGVCCTCKAKVLEGSVRMDLNFALEEDEIADGFVLTCQAHPTSKKVVISYDEY